MTRALLTTSLAAAALSGAAPARAAAQDAPAAHDASPRAGRWEWATHHGEAGTRRYRLFVPSVAGEGDALPLVVMLHGCTQDPDDFARGTRMNEAAAEMGFLVAYPEQPASAHPQKCWTWYDPAHQGRGGEPALVAAIAREVAERHGADPRRVYVAGISAGGAMAVNAAAAYPEVFAAAAAHSGVAYRAAGGVPQALGVMQQGAPDAAALAEAAAAAVRERGGPLPLMVIHGAADPVVRPVNADQLFAQWAGAAGAGEPRTERVDAAGHGAARTWVGPADAPLVVRLVVDGLGHAWSGGSAEGTYTHPGGPDATRLAAAFLLSHSRRDP